MNCCTWDARWCFAHTPLVPTRGARGKTGSERIYTTGQANASRLSARQDESQSFALAKARRRSRQARLVDADLRKSLDDLLSEAVAFQATSDHSQATRRSPPSQTITWPVMKV